MAAPNAIEQRLAALAERWLAFTDETDAPALRWVVAPDSVAMVDAFVSVEAGEAGTLSDLFVRFDHPFAADARYGAALATLLVAGIAEATAEEDTAAPWTPPPPHGDDALDFAATCAALAGRHAGLFEHLALVLAPESVDDDDAFARWARLVVCAGLPPSVRLLLLDRADAPRLEALAAAEPERVVSDPVDLDMASAYQELASAGDPTDPGVRFRQHFVAMTGAIGADAGAAQRHGDAALTVAVANAWPALEVAVHAALGSASLAANAPADALVAFRAGRAAAERAEAAADPAGSALVVQTRMAEAVALVAAGQFAEAGVLYQSTAPLAAARDDATLTLENWRMASYCFEQVDRSDLAWAAGLRAIQAAEPVDAAARRQTTLPYVGQGLLRLAEKPGYRALGPGIRDTMATLLGPDWQTLLEASPTPT